jgi:hypothetical protein
LLEQVRTMRSTPNQVAALRVVELMVDDHATVRYVTSKTDEYVGRERNDTEEATDHEWWYVYRSILGAVILEAYFEVDPFKHMALAL